MRLLAKDPDDRYADADAAVEAIDAATRPPLAFGAQGGAFGGDHTPLSIAESARIIRVPRRGAMFVAAGVAVAAIAIGSIALLSRGDSPPAPSALQPAATAIETSGATARTATVTATATATSKASATAPAAPDYRDRLHVAAAGTDADAAKVALLDLVERDAAQLPDVAVRADAAAAAALAAAQGDVASVVDPLVRVEGGLDVLYEIVTRDTAATGPAAGPSRAAAVRARELLGKPENYARTSPALKVALELRAAPCTKRVYMLPRAVAEGDERALGILTAMRPPTCGPDGGGCCQKSPDLDKAIEDLSAKSK